MMQEFNRLYRMKKLKNWSCLLFMMTSKLGQPVDFLKWQQIIDQMNELGCDHLILGCTELSIVKKELNLDEYYIDSLMVLAESAILSCGYELND